MLADEDKLIWVFSMRTLGLRVKVPRISSANANTLHVPLSCLSSTQRHVLMNLDAFFRVGRKVKQAQQAGFYWILGVLRNGFWGFR